MRRCYQSIPSHIIYKELITVLINVIIVNYACYYINNYHNHCDGKIINISVITMLISSLIIQLL